MKSLSINRLAKGKIIPLAIGLGSLFWFIDSAIDALIFGNGTFIQQVTAPDDYEIWIRMVVMSILIVVGIFAQRLITKQHNTIQLLNEALSTVKTLSGLLPICAWCKKIRDDKGYWKSVEKYISTHTGAEFTHGICPECKNNFYTEYMEKNSKANNNSEVS